MCSALALLSNSSVPMNANGLARLRWTRPSKRKRWLGLCPFWRRVFALAAGDNLEHGIWQRSLEPACFIPRRAHPNVAFLLGGEDHRHGLRMYRRNYVVRFRCQQATKLTPRCSTLLLPLRNSSDRLIRWRLRGLFCRHGGS